MAKMEVKIKNYNENATALMRASWAIQNKMSKSLCERLIEDYMSLGLESKYLDPWFPKETLRRLGFSEERTNNMLERYGIAEELD